MTSTPRRCVEMAPFGRWVLAGLAALAAASTPSPVAHPDSLQFGAETTSEISRDDLDLLRVSWHVAIPEQSDAAPLFVSGIDIGGTSHDLLIVETKQGQVLALDSGSGPMLWQPRQPLGVHRTAATPAVDPARQFVN